MTPAAALRVIRRCIDSGRVIVKDHFLHRRAGRGMFWADVLAIIDRPARMRTAASAKVKTRGIVPLEV